VRLIVHVYDAKLMGTADVQAKIYLQWVSGRANGKKGSLTSNSKGGRFVWRNGHGLCIGHGGDCQWAGQGDASKGTEMAHGEEA
jgi:hypothetical protein